VVSARRTQRVEDEGLTPTFAATAGVGLTDIVADTTMPPRLPSGVTRRAWEEELCKVKEAVTAFIDPSRRVLFRVNAYKSARMAAVSEFELEVADMARRGVVMSYADYYALFSVILDMHIQTVDIGVVPTPTELAHVAEVLTMNWFRFTVFVSTQQPVDRTRASREGIKIAGPSSGTNSKAFALGMLLILKEGIGPPGMQTLAPDRRLAWVPSSELVKTATPECAKLLVLKRVVTKFILQCADVCTQMYL
jgi:hypothetical protein